MFKKGDKVRCIDDETLITGLTLGKVYIIVDSGLYPNFVTISNDNGYVRHYFEGRFKLVNEENTLEFQLGDIVEFGGLEGRVDEVNQRNDYPIRVTLENESCHYFTTDGRWHKNHTKPLLNPVSRPKKKEKRIVKTTVHYSPSLNGVFTGLEKCLPDDLIWVTLEKEIEVEV